MTSVIECVRRARPYRGYRIAEQWERQFLLLDSFFKFSWTLSTRPAEKYEAVPPTFFFLLNVIKKRKNQKTTKQEILFFQKLKPEECSRLRQTAAVFCACRSRRGGWRQSGTGWKTELARPASCSCLPWSDSLPSGLAPRSCADCAKAEWMGEPVTCPLQIRFSVVWWKTEAFLYCFNLHGW